MEYVRFVLAVYAVLFIALNSDASVVYFGAELQVINVKAGQPTLLRFPKPVQTVTDARRFTITPANLEQPDYSLLQITPIFSTGVSNVSFVLTDGSIVRTRVRILPPNAEGDSDLYDFKYKSELVSKELNIAASVPVNDLDLMKAMIRGHTVSGYKKTSPSLEVSTGTKHVKATLEAMWKGRGAFIGYQFRIENSTNNQEYQMDLRRLNIGSPNLAVLSQVDDPIIVGQNRKGPKQTRLRIVAKPSSSTSDVVLPVQWLKRGGK